MASLASEVVTKSNGMIADQKTKAQQNIENLMERPFNLAQSTAESIKSGREYVKEHPIKGVAVAAVAGLFAGSLLTVLFKRQHKH